MPVFHLYLESGEDIGEYRTSRWTWMIGDEFVADDGSRFAILDLLDFEKLASGLFAGVFIVTPITLAEPVQDPEADAEPLDAARNDDTIGSPSSGLSDRQDAVGHTRRP